MGSPGCSIERPSADDTDRHGRSPFDPERTADRDPRLAPGESGRIAQLHRSESASLDLEEGEVGEAIGADERAPEGPSVAEGDLDLLGALNGVFVGEDVPPAIDDEARAQPTRGERLVELVALDLARRHADDRGQR